MGPLFALLLGLAVLFVLLFVGSALLRAAVALANRAIGSIGQERIIGWDWDEDEDEDEDDEPEGRPAMREPGTGQGMYATFIVGVLHLVVAFIFTAAFRIERPLRDSDELPLVVLCLAVGSVLGFFALSGLLTAQLGTKWRWALAAAFFYYLIGLLVFLGVLALLFAVFG
jgi:hypothetical protein